MKSLRTLFTTVATINFLAMLLFAGWLWQSGRIDAQKVNAIRGMLAEPGMGWQDELLAAGAAAADGQPGEAAPPLPSGARIDQIGMVRSQETQSRRRLAEEKDMLLRQVANARRAIDAKEEELATERARWEEAMRRQRDLKVDEQFLKTVRQYEALPGKQGKKMITQLVEEGRTERAIAYLDAMNTRAATKILREFKTQEELDLATLLLEDLGRYGLAADAENPPGALDSAAPFD